MKPTMRVAVAAGVLVLAACGSGAEAGGSVCASGELEVTACGGGEKACVRHAPAITCDAFDRAQPASDNPCRFGNKYSATCAQITAGRVSCGCF